jgi:hypothetical protein
MIMSEKRVSIAATNALKEALTCAYWYKPDLRNFLSLAVSNNELILRLNWTDYKRNIVGSLVDHLATNQNVYQGDLLRLMSEVTNIKDFRHLEKLEDGADKAKKARIAIVALAEIYKTHQDIVNDQEHIDENRRQAYKRQLQNKGVRDKLEELKSEFLSLFRSDNPQARGYSLEKIIRELFTLFDLDPKASFKVVGEQIDGAFTFDSTDYLFEAKWQKNPVDIGDLDGFSGKLARKLDNTLGLFLSLNGYSKDAIMAHSSGRKMMILMDGSDLTAVLEERIDLQYLLMRKRRHASQTGEIYLPSHKFLE